MMYRISPRLYQCGTSEQCSNFFRMALYERIYFLVCRSNLSWSAVTRSPGSSLRPPSSAVYRRLSAAKTASRDFWIATMRISQCEICSVSWAAFGWATMPDPEHRSQGSCRTLYLHKASQGSCYRVCRPRSMCSLSVFWSSFESPSEIQWIH